MECAHSPQCLVRHQKLSDGLVTAYVCAPTFVPPGTALPKIFYTSQLMFRWLIRQLVSTHIQVIPGNQPLSHQYSQRTMCFKVSFFVVRHRHITVSG